MSDTTYNGWTNYDTWNANLWLKNDEGVYKHLIHCNNETEIGNLFRRMFKSGNGEYIDGIDPSKVNWDEIFYALEK